MAAITVTAGNERVSTRLIFALGGIALGAWAPLVTLAKIRLGLGDGALGLALLSMGVGSIIAMPMTALLTSRFGCRFVPVLAAFGDGGIDLGHGGNSGGVRVCRHHRRPTAIGLVAHATSLQTAFGLLCGAMVIIAISSRPIFHRV